MPLNIIGSMLLDGPDVLPGWQHIKTYGPWVVALASLKYYFRGKTNTWERDLHGKVYIVTGGTSGLGAKIVDEIASKGAQVILLVRSVEDFWITDYINDLRERHNNFLIYAEECDLSSLYSVRKFATKWLDNVPPRRIDGVICCAAEALPPYVERQNSIDGIEIQNAVNYAGHYHLLTLLSPSLRSQIADRDVRVVIATCIFQAMGDVDLNDPLYQNKRYPTNKPLKVFGGSKLKLGLFAREYQRRLLSVPRKDGASCNVRVNLVNPGLMRSPSTKRVLSFGSLLGLLIYVLLLPLFWIFLKSTGNGAESFLHVLYSPDFINLHGGNFIADCTIYKPARSEFDDVELQKTLYDNTAKEIERIEKESAIARKRAEKFAKDGQKKEANVEKNDISLATSKETLFPDSTNEKTSNEKTSNEKKPTVSNTSNSKGKNKKKTKKL